MWLAFGVSKENAGEEGHDSTKLAPVVREIGPLA
jgi:hypothetical protein